MGLARSLGVTVEAAAGSGSLVPESPRSGALGRYRGRREKYGLGPV